MNIGEIGKCHVVVAQPELSVLEVAKLMKENNIGNIVVVNEKNEPIGMITDRDITVKIVVEDINASDLRAADIMSEEVLILKDYQSMQEALDMMAARGIRRAPIVDETEALIGIISSDDFAILIADQIQSYSKLIKKQISLSMK